MTEGTVMLFLLHCVLSTCITTGLRRLGLIMSTAPDGTTLGRCPLCRVAIPAEQLVIEYSPETGWPQMLASCRRCDEVVGPV